MRRVYVLAPMLGLLMGLMVSLAAACAAPTPTPTPTQTPTPVPTLTATPAMTDYDNVEVFYTYPSTDGLSAEARAYGQEVWYKVRGDASRFVLGPYIRSVLIFLHPYTVGVFDPSTAEWVAIVSQAPGGQETRMALFRLDYQTFQLKRAYQFIYATVPDLTQEQAIALIEQEMRAKDPYAGERKVDKEQMEYLGGNYVYTYPAGDFGGTLVVNKYAGKVVFFATTWWMGRGKLFTPGE